MRRGACLLRISGGRTAPSGIPASWAKKCACGRRSICYGWRPRRLTSEGKERGDLEGLLDDRTGSRRVQGRHQVDGAPPGGGPNSHESGQADHQ